MAASSPANSIIEGTVKFRDGKKWKSRWCVMRKLSPVADSLPMKGGSDRYRHRNNYDPFFVTVTASAKSGYVLSYLEVSATTDASGEVTFCMISGKTGSRSMVFQLTSNHSEFLSYSYMAYGLKEEQYKKVTTVSFGGCH